MRSAKGKLCLGLAFGIGILVLSGCSASVETKADVIQPEPAPQPPAVPLGVSINAVMVGLVDHASHVIWDAATPEKSPKNDKAWEEIQHHATQLAAAGSVIALAGTGKSDAAWVKNPEWKRLSQELADSGVAAGNAARDKNVKALSEAGDKLVTTCESCHKLYKGDLPTEGIVHPH